LHIGTDSLLSSAMFRLNRFLDLSNAHLPLKPHEFVTPAERVVY
jgi:hypothetical protein